MERYRITSDAAVYFVTYSVVDWLPAFVSESTCRIVTDSLNYCHAHKRLGVNAYVLMPSHMHAVVFDRDFDSKRLQQTLTDFRKFTGRTLCDFFETRRPHAFADVFQSASTEDRERRFWQPSRHPEAIETEPFWRQKVDYTHENPCRKGLVRRAGDWRFSSAAYYVSEGHAACDVPISPIDWS